MAVFALIAVAVLLNIGQLVTFFIVLIRLFKEKGVLHLILGFFCGIYTFIWGWLNHRTQDLSKVMFAWTGMIILSIFIGGALSVMAPDFITSKLGPRIETEMKKTVGAKKSKQVPPKPAKKPVTVTDADIVTYGVYEVALKDKVEKNTLSSEGERLVLDSYELVRQTEIVPKKIGTYFGFEYVLIGSPKNKKVLLNIHTTLKFLDKDEIIYESITPEEAVIGEIQLVAFHLKNELETVPGRWTFELQHGENVLLTKNFQVIGDDSIGSN